VAKAQALASSSARSTEESVASDRPIYPPASARTNTLIAGAATTAVWYGGAVGFSYLWPDAPGATDLRIPIAGPWMALADTGCAKDDPDCSVILVIFRALLTGIDGVGQAGGLLVMAEGLFLPTEAPRTGLYRPSREKPSLSLSLRPAPMLSERGEIGLGVAGRF
jgi:hypothetical protein